MFFADLHTHSHYSSDGCETFSDLRQAAGACGLGALAFTDHCEPPPCTFALEDMIAEWDALEESPGLLLLRGAEVGDPHKDPAWARDMLAQPCFDIALCSLHTLAEPSAGAKDFYFMEYKSEAQCRALLRAYLDEHRAFFDCGAFDVLCHLGYPLRYMAAQGFFPSLTDHEPLLRRLFDLMVRHEVALEVNTKSQFGPLGAPNADEAMLRLYYDCGGRLVTIGTDAHAVAEVGRGLADAQRLLKKVGFTHQALFQKRRRRLLPL